MAQRKLPVMGYLFRTASFIRKVCTDEIFKKAPLPAPVRLCFSSGAPCWVLFAFEDMGQGFQYLLQMTGAAGLSLCNERTIFLLSGNLVLLAACALGSHPPAGQGCREMERTVSRNPVPGPGTAPLPWPTW